MLAKKKNKVLAVIALFLFVSLCFVSPAFADRISDDLKSAASGSGEDIVEIADRGGYAFVSTIRELAVIGALIFGVWAGLIFFAAGDNEMKLSRAKGKLIVFLLCLILIFKTESIVVSIFNLLGLESFLS